MTKHSIGRIFADRKASRLFSDYYDHMGEDDKHNFSVACKELADKKITSEDGEYEEFYLTTKDIIRVFNSI